MFGGPNEAVRLDFLNAVRAPHTRIRSAKVLNAVLPSVFEGQAGLRLDLLVEDEKGGRFHVEMQRRSDHEIGAKLKALRSQGSDTAWLAGKPLAHDGFGSARLMAMNFALGPPNLYSFLCDEGAPLIRASELVIGHPMILQSDIARAHYAVILGANAPDIGWGPLQIAPDMNAELAHARKVKSCKIAVADARRTEFGKGADVFLHIRPGTELWLLLGMIRHILDNNWRDVQYTDDWTEGLGDVGEVLAPWTLDRCAKVCGVTSGELGGVALKFSRAAMAVCHLGPQAQRGPNATLTAWASLCLHALTANLLRPGGLYTNAGLGPAAEWVTALRSDKAPQVGGLPLLLAQNSAHRLPERFRTPGHDQLRGLIAVNADPASELVGKDVPELLGALDLLVLVETHESASTRFAHYVLPAAAPGEFEDCDLMRSVAMPRRSIAWTTPERQPPGEARPTERILRDLYLTQPPALRSPFGPHLRLRAGLMARGDMGAWFAAKLGDTPARSRENLPWDGGDVDRATWSIGHTSGRFALLPEVVRAGVAGLREPVGERWLQTSSARAHGERVLGVGLHPDCGFAEGQMVTVRTRGGSLQVAVRWDAELRPDSVDLPAGYGMDVARLIPDDALDAETGTPIWDGLGCEVVG